MARGFSISSYLERTGVSSFGAPLTLALWVNLNSTAAQQVLLSCDEASGGDICELYVNSAGKLGLYAEQQGIGNISIVGTTTISTGTWTHLAVACSSGDSQIWVNGASDGTSSTSRTISTLTQFHIATRRYSGGLAEYANGKIAEAAVYSARLATADIASLAKGYTPDCVRRQNIMAYWPLGGHHGQHDNDHWKNGYDLTAVNSPTWADHGRVIYPRRRVWNVAWSAPAAYTLTCTTATCSGTRRSAGLYCGKKIAAATGTCTGTRNTLTLLASRKIVATVGSCSGSRKSLVLTAQRVLSGSVAAGSGSRKTCALLAARTLAAAQGTCSGTRRDARLLAGRLATCVARSGSGSSQTCVLRTAKTLVATHGACVGARGDVRLRAGRLTTCVARSGSVTPQTAGLRCSRYLAVVVRLGTGTSNAASLEYSGAAAEFDYSVTAATEAVARRLCTEARSRSVRSEAVARRAATESLCRAVRTEALARRLGTEAR